MEASCRVKVSIVIPTLNEWENIKKLIPKIIIEIKKVGIRNFEIIVVDDDSDDHTGKKLEKEYKDDDRVRVVVRKECNGLAGAILEGINISKGEVIVGMDADFNHDPSVLDEIINKTKESDFVLASRFVEGGGMDDKIRYFLTKLFNIFLVAFLGFPTTDNMSGYYAINRKILRKIPSKRIYLGYGDYHLRLVWALKLLRAKICEVPVYYYKRKYGKSKSNLFYMFWKYLREAFRLSGIKCINEI